MSFKIENLSTLMSKISFLSDTLTPEEKEIADEFNNICNNCSLQSIMELRPANLPSTMLDEKLDSGVYDSRLLDLGLLTHDSLGNIERNEPAYSLFLLQVMKTANRYAISDSPEYYAACEKLAAKAIEQCFRQLQHMQ